MIDALRGKRPNNLQVYLRDESAWKKYTCFHSGILATGWKVKKEKKKKKKENDRDCGGR